MITTNTQENVLVIPEEALVENESGIYVYTTYDEKTGELGGLIPVTTGISDGIHVEILEGLKEGSTYCYSYQSELKYGEFPVGDGLPPWRFTK